MEVSHTKMHTVLVRVCTFVLIGFLADMTKTPLSLHFAKHLTSLAREDNHGTRRLPPHRLRDGVCGDLHPPVAS